MLERRLVSSWCGYICRGIKKQSSRNKHLRSRDRTRLRSPKMESLRCMDHMDDHMAHPEKRPASRDGCGWLQTKQTAVQTTCLV